MYVCVCLCVSCRYEHERKGSASELDKSLASLAASGYLPINAQAAENGVSSSGSWGPAGG